MYVCVTNVDAITGIVCTQEPMKNGPAIPKLSGWNFEFANSSAHPIQCDADGSYKAAPLYYGTCDNNVNMDIPGIVKSLTKAEFEKARDAEMKARPAPIQPTATI
jgi:hypothetical protein